MGPKFEVIFISHVISTSSHPSGFSNDARNRPNRIHVLKKHAADLSASKVDSSRDILSKSEVPKVAENVPRHLPHIPFNPEKRRQKKDFFSKKTVSHSYVIESTSSENVSLECCNCTNNIVLSQSVDSSYPYE